ncbi:hypothetical protein GGR56DRAFT_662704 [Xylariaceae sp. FL0804]|nr:hypothetical protein GGR56DRAFT_662704 [Xylariaceae sp. FL0804]
MAHQMGPPYPVNEAVVGGTPTVGVDDPISAVLLALFLATAAAHMTVFQINKRRGLKFIFSGMLFALGMLRSVALTMRIVWASNAHSIKVGIAAGILTQVGSVLILIINLILTQRIVRAYHPGFGWHKAPRFVLRFLVGSVVGCLVMLIVCTIQTFLTLDPTTRANDRKVQLFSATFLTTLAFLPVPIILLAAIAPRNNAIERFGAGSWRAKLWLILFTACLATLGAGFRAGTAFDARPHGASAWFLTRPCYYCFNYVTDLLCSVAYLFSRFDRRFIIPNGSCKPGDYSLGVHHGPTDRSHGADHDGFDGPRGGSDERRDVDGRSYGRTGGEKGERTKTKNET